MKKYTIEEVRKSFEDKGFILSEDSYYIDIFSKTLTYTCPLGHTHTTSFQLWKRTYKCKTCNIKNSRKKRRLSYDFVKNEFNKEDYELTSKEYINNSQKLDAICKNGHEISISYANFSRGRRCRYCNIESIKKNLSLDYEFIKQQFKNEEYELLSKDYNNAHTKLEYKCSNGHICEISYNKFQQGERCPKCNGNISRAEDELYQIISENITSIQCDKKIIKPYELDIVIPSKKTAIEYCGLFWHSESQGKDKRYHLDKLNKCNKKGYNLITIFEDEWINNKGMIIGRLRNYLGISDAKKIYARKCIVEEINTESARNFLEDNHTQGFYPSSIKLGLIYKSKILAVMTFSSLSISKGASSIKNVFELSRFCSDYNYRIIGGASKLLNYFIKNYKPKEIISYADRRWSSGKLYDNLGFKFVRNTEPNYWYLVRGKNNYIRKHRFGFRKSVLKNKLPKFDEKLTEYENCLMNGIDRIWDCGNKKYIMETL